VGKCSICEGFSDDYPENPVLEVVRHHSHLPPFNFVGLAHSSCKFMAEMKNYELISRMNLGIEDKNRDNLLSSKKGIFTCNAFMYYAGCLT